MHAWLEIDRDVIRRNYQKVREAIGNTVEVIAVVKSNAYGHGLEEVVKLLNETDVEMFAVISIEEARQVAGISSKPVLVMGYLDSKEITDAIDEGFVLNLHDLEQAPMYQRFAERMGRNARVHLKVETGLNRLGVTPEQAVDLLTGQDRYPNLKIEAMFSHLACSTEKDKNMAQLRILQDILIDIEGKAPLLPVHLDSSYALKNFSEGYFDAVRLGLALYGVDEVLPGLEPSLTCKSVVMQVKKVKKGEGISYGHLFVAPKDIEVAVIAIGYADGLSQALRDKLTVLIDGREAPVLGQICMNMIIADVSGIEAKRGTEVVIIGKQKGSDGKIGNVAITDLAKRSSIRHHEILIRMGLALPKRYFN